MPFFSRWSWISSWVSIFFADIKVFRARESWPWLKGPPVLKLLSLGRCQFGVAHIYAHKIAGMQVQFAHMPAIGQFMRISGLRHRLFCWPLFIYHLNLFRLEELT